MNKKIIILIVAVFAVTVGVYFFRGNKLQNVTQAQDQKIVEDNGFYDINATYPTEPRDTGKIMEKFVTYNVGNKKEEWKTGGEVYNAEQELKKQFPDRPPMKYELDIRYTKYESLKLDTVSYVFTSYEFSGGAHGNTGLSTFTFNKNGQVTIDNIFNFENYNDIAVTKLVANKLPSVLGDYTNKEMIDSGLGIAYLKEDGKTIDKTKCNCDGFFFPSNLQNFIVGDEGVTFVMGQYQVAPYVAGMPEVTLSWNELSPYLNSDFKVN